MVELKKKLAAPTPLGVLFSTLALASVLVGAPAAWALQEPAVEQTPAQAPPSAATDEVPQDVETVSEEAVAPEPAPEVSIEVGEASAVLGIGDEREEEGERRRHRRAVDKDTQIHIGSDLVVREDEVARDAVVISGSLDVRGKVIGDAICILGSVTIDGEVTGEVVAVGGSVYLGPDAEVMGDVISIGGRVERESGARILGEISEISIGPGVTWRELPMFWRSGGSQVWDIWHLGAAWSLFWMLFKWVLLVLLTSFVFLVAREPVERTSRQIRGEFWKSSLLGLVAIVFFPFLFAMVAIVLAITIIGIPLLIVVLPLGVMLLIFALLLGYTSAAYTTGNWLARRFGWSLSSPYMALLTGLVALHLLSLAARLLGTLGGYVWFFALMFGLAGWCVRFIAWTAGLGAALLTQFGRREPGRMPPPVASAGDPAPAPPPLPPGSPSPPAVGGEDAPDESD